MASLIDRAKALWDSAKAGPTKLPTPVAIPVGQVDTPAITEVPFRGDQHYFEVKVNQLYLGYQRQWFKTYDPMVLVLSEFAYAKSNQLLPYVVGPAMMRGLMQSQEGGQELPSGMMLFDTRVAGIHPFKGGQLGLSVILYRSATDDAAKRVLQLVENAVQVLDFATALSVYVKIASVMLDGVEAICGLQDTVPVMGLRQEFSLAKDDLGSGYFALIDAPKVDAGKLRVVDRRLHWQDDPASQPVPFEDAHDADFVLYSVTQSPSRDDLQLLPFFPLWEDVMREATVAKDSAWENAKANMAVLYQAMVMSPDLTLSHALEQRKQWVETMKLLHDGAVAQAELGEPPPPQPERDALRADVSKILTM